MKEFNKYVGLDVHKDTIAVSIADKGRGQSRYFGEIVNKPQEVDKLVKRLSPNGEVTSFCYEAGACGYSIYRQITKMGHECEVVAPSLIPKKSGDRIKNDRRDSDGLARLHRAGELTAVWVPDQDQEAIRDLVRCRDDIKQMEKKARQLVNAFVLRHGHRYTKPTKWTQAHWRWLEKIKIDHPQQKVVLQEYIDAVQHSSARVKELEAEMAKALEYWSLAPVVEGLMAMRGIDLVSAMGLIAELGDLTRFARPTQLMAYLGLVPSAYDSGQTQRRGGITKAGNSHARRILVESAWSYQFPARKSRRIQRRAEKCEEAIQAIAWKGQLRLCGRYRSLINRSMMKVKAITAVAREMCGFIWAIANEVMRKLRPTIVEA